MQRFGTGNVPTYVIGIALLKRNFKLAVELILAPASASSGSVHEDGISNQQQQQQPTLLEKPEVIAAKEYFKRTRDCQGTLDMLPFYLNSERKVLEGLRDGGHTDYLFAIQNITRNMRIMFVHSVQSLIWNHAATFRLQMPDAFR